MQDAFTTFMLLEISGFLDIFFASSPCVLPYTSRNISNQVQGSEPSLYSASLYWHNVYVKDPYSGTHVMCVCWTRCSWTPTPAAPVLVCPVPLGHSNRHGQRGSVLSPWSPLCPSCPLQGYSDTLFFPLWIYYVFVILCLFPFLV